MQIRAFTATKFLVIDHGFCSGFDSFLMLSTVADLAHHEDVDITQCKSVTTHWYKKQGGWGATASPPFLERGHAPNMLTYINHAYLLKCFNTNT